MNWHLIDHPKRIQLRLASTPHQSTILSVRMPDDIEGQVVIVDDAGALHPCEYLDGVLRWSSGDAGAYWAYFGGEGPTTTPVVNVREVDDYRGQDSLEIVTDAATYVYHKAGAGLASMFDIEGKDWISYWPEGGAAGHYRGLPNMVQNVAFHPGYEGATTEVIHQSALSARVRSGVGDWVCEWTFWPTFAEFTLLSVGQNQSGGDEFWFLYEGTPYGELDMKADYYALSNGNRFTMAEQWEGPMPDPRWVVFGSTRTERKLYLWDHQQRLVRNVYYTKDDLMTVWGFGRRESYGRAALLKGAPATFTLGFLEGDALPMNQQTLQISVGDVEVR